MPAEGQLHGVKYRLLAGWVKVGSRSLQECVNFQRGDKRGAMHRERRVHAPFSLD